MSDIRFTALETRGLWMCGRCGAAVAVRDGHADWHGRLTEMTEALSVALLPDLTGGPLPGGPARHPRPTVHPTS